MLCGLLSDCIFFNIFEASHPFLRYAFVKTGNAVDNRAITSNTLPNIFCPLIIRITDVISAIIKNITRKIM